MSNDNSKPAVSVICTAYNHEKYIRQCLEGFVMQKTDFPFEVIVHDDASTDGTADIIREFAAKYPDIIKPVLQTENQYSQSIPIMRTFMYPIAQGDFFAYCEGDDYWIDPDKLQRQYDYLTEHPEYTLCAHNVYAHNLTTGKKYMYTKFQFECNPKVDAVIMGGGSYFATNSLLVRKEAVLDLPECFRSKGFGDYQIAMHAAITGKCHVFVEFMSVTNRGVEGSWTSRNFNDESKRVVHYRKVIDLLQTIDKYYDGKYHAPISKTISKHEFDIALLEKDYKVMVRPEHKKRFRKQYKTGKERFRIYLKAWFPHLARAYRKITR